LKQERTEAVACGVTEGRDSHRVVTAREREALKRDAIAADRSEEFVGQLVREGGVVAPAYRQDFLAVPQGLGNFRRQIDVGLKPDIGLLQQQINAHRELSTSLAYEDA